MKTQRELFDDIKNLALKVDNLKGYVQNGFDQMIADGTVTKEDLKDSLDDILDEFDIIETDEPLSFATEEELDKFYNRNSN